MKTFRQILGAVALCFVASMFTGCELFFDLKDNPISTTLSMPTLELTLYEGQTAVRKATTASPGAITYTSSNPEVASVDNNGNVTALKEGTATITAHVAEIDYWSSAEVSYQVRVLKRNTLATINLKALNVFQDPQNKIIKQIPVAKLTLKSSWLPGGELVCDDQIASPSSTITLKFPNPPSGEQNYDIVATDTNGDEWTAENVSLALEDGINPDTVISLFNATFCPLTIEVTEDNTDITLKNNAGKTFQYLVNGKDKISITNTENITGLKAGDKVQFFSTNGATATSLSDYFNIKPNKTAYVYGNVMSLIDDGSDGFAADKTVANYALTSLFRGADKITFHNTKRLLLPATQLSCYCYAYMFKGCTNLITTPVINVVCNNDDYCFCNMFDGCTNLKIVAAGSQIKGSMGTNDCFRMFYGCSSLTSVPADFLPSTSLGDGCYGGMFRGCTSLQNAPKLPATTLKETCYGGMFIDCSKLESVTCLATSYAEANSLSDWLDGAGTSATGTKTFIVNSAYSAQVATAQSNLSSVSDGTSLGISPWVKGVNGIPAGWTIQAAD